MASALFAVVLFALGSLAIRSVSAQQTGNCLSNGMCLTHGVNSPKPGTNACITDWQCSCQASGWIPVGQPGAKCGAGGRVAMPP